MDIPELTTKVKKITKQFEKRDRIDWQPFPQSPQSLAYHSSASELLYGGAAGGGKSQLLIGLALTGNFKKSLVLRREYSQINDLISKMQDLVPSYGGGNILRLQDRTIELGGCKLNADWRKYKGREHSLKGFDELSEFTEEQYTSIIAWNRSPDPNEQCRIVATSNPPDSREGEWMIKRWGSWLDPVHPSPAASGELRYYIRLPDGSEEEIPDPDPVELDGRLVYPKSRTFIRASVLDNPRLLESGYDQTLNSLPEPLRSKLLLGDFLAGMDDNPYQVIPAEWIKSAQSRWCQHVNLPQRAIALDIARGGKDFTTAAYQCGDFIYVEKISGSKTPDASSVGLFLSRYHKNNSLIHVDCIGVGASIVDYLRSKNLRVIPMNAAEKSYSRDRTGLVEFANKRAEWWWGLRDLLDPQQKTNLALPPDKEVLGDLSAPRYKLTTRGILIESKDEIRKRIGRSTDVGDAIAMCCAIAGNSTISIKGKLNSWKA